MNRRIFILILIALSWISLLLASYGAFKTREQEKSYIKDSIGVSKKRPPGVRGLGIHSLFYIETTVTPDRVKLDEDIVVKVVVSKTRLENQTGHLDIRIDTPSFDISPNEIKKVFIKNGESTNFLLTPKSKGNKKIRVYARYVPSAQAHTIRPEVQQPEREQIVDVEVYSTQFLGIGREVLAVIQATSAIIGMPAILLLVVSNRMERKKKGEKYRNRIILPK